MSALGDYVHLETQNYLKYGVNKIGDTPALFKAPSNFLQNRTSGIKSISKETIATLEKRLSRNTPTATNSDKVIIDKDFQNKIDKIYDLLAKTTSVENLGRMQGSSAWKASESAYKEAKAKTLTKNEIQMVKNRLQQLDNEITKLNQKGTVSQEEFDNLLKSYADIIPKYLDDTSGPPASNLGKLQEMIQNTAYNTWISNLVGDFGEHLVALCDDTIEKQVDVSLDDFEKTIVGAERSNITVSKDSVAKDLSSYFKKDEYGDYYLGTSQNKVDVKINVNMEDVLASVKMYYDANQITLQSQVNLFTALNYLEQYDRFGTHWMNMHAARRGKAAAAKYNPEADEILTQELAFEALASGNPMKKNITNANVFVYLDRKTGRVFAKSTKDLLLNEFYRFKISPAIRGVTLKNIFDPDGYQDRITQLLIEAHQTQFYVHMDVTK